MNKSELVQLEMLFTDYIATKQYQLYLKEFETIKELNEDLSLHLEEIKEKMEALKKHTTSKWKSKIENDNSIILDYLNETRKENLN